MLVLSNFLQPDIHVNSRDDRSLLESCILPDVEVQHFTPIDAQF